MAQALKSNFPDCLQSKGKRKTEKSLAAKCTKKMAEALKFQFPWMLAVKREKENREILGCNYPDMFFWTANFFFELYYPDMWYVQWNIRGLSATSEDERQEHSPNADPIHPPRVSMPTGLAVYMQSPKGRWSMLPAMILRRSHHVITWQYLNGTTRYGRRKAISAWHTVKQRYWRRARET